VRSIFGCVIISAFRYRWTARFVAALPGNGTVVGMADSFSECAAGKAVILALAVVLNDQARKHAKTVELLHRLPTDDLSEPGIHLRGEVAERLRILLRVREHLAHGLPHSFHVIPLDRVGALHRIRLAAGCP